MPRRLWLLVEWVGENDVFSSYSVVNTDSAIGAEKNFDIGNIIYLLHNNDARRAKILKISDKKRSLKELKVLLEKQDSQMKNVLSLCMNTLKDMKTNAMELDPQFNRNDDSDSNESDNENNDQDINFSKLTNKFTSKRSSLSRHHSTSFKQTPFKNKCSLMSSTPFPERSKLTFDQATQTDPVLDPNLTKIEHLESMLQRLYQQFLSLIGEAPPNITGSTIGVDYSETEISEMDNQSENTTVKEEVDLASPFNTNEVDTVDENNKQVKRLCIRRASAQTTNTSLPNPNPDVNMIPIGAGATKLPVTVINAIDWSSYSTATRQLLQAIFPRKVLATHSLTGKQSPAFANKPPKKALDSKIVNDIVDTVSDVCGVSKRIVRSCITTKCTDEAKLYRNRQQYKSNNESRDHQDNSIANSPSSNEIITKKE